MKNKFSYIIWGFLLLSAPCTAQNVSNGESKITTTVLNPESTLVDVRTAEQFKQNPVKNAINIPLKEIENNLDFFRQQKQVVLFCNTGRQAEMAYDLLKKNNIKNIYNATSWKNVMIMQNNYINKLTFSTGKPSTFAIKKTDKIQQIAVGLGEGAVLKKHITPVPTNLVMVQGEIIFKINETELNLKKGDVYEIPVNTDHVVVGKDKENVFILTKEL